MNSCQNTALFHFDLFCQPGGFLIGPEEQINHEGQHCDSEDQANDIGVSREKAVMPVTAAARF